VKASKTDISKMLAKHRKILEAGPEARRAGLRELATPVLRQVESLAPRDTQRYVRAYMQAGQELGVPVAVPQVVKGHFADEFLPRLKAQLSYWMTRQRQYENAGRTREKYYRKILRRVNQCRTQLERWDPSAIIVFGRHGKTVTRAISQVYGGAGRFVDVGSRTFLQLTNKEPHARIVESRHFPMREILKSGKAVGLAKAKREHLKAIKAAAGK